MAKLKLDSVKFEESVGYLKKCFNTEILERVEGTYKAIADLNDGNPIVNFAIFTLSYSCYNFIFNFPVYYNPIISPILCSWKINSTKLKTLIKVLISYNPLFTF